MRRISLYASFLWLLACDTEPFHQPDGLDTEINAAIETRFRQIEENLQAENHEAYIRDFIALLDYTQQLPPDSPTFLEVCRKLVHYANTMRLYSQGIELTDAMLASLETDSSATGISWKETAYAARAGCQFELHQYEKALQSYSKQLYYQDLLNPSQEHVSVMNNIGMAFKYAGDVDSAMYYFRRVESILNRPKTVPLLGEFKQDEIFAGSVKDNIASILVEQEQDHVAEILYRENFSMYRKYTQHPIRLVNAGIQLARLQLRSAQPAATAHTIHILDSLFQTLSYPGKREQELAYYQILAQYYQRFGDAPNVIRFQKAYMNLADSLYSAQLERTRLLSNELMQYKAKQFRQELEIEQREAMHNQQKAKSRFRILVLFIFLSLSGGVLLTISLRQRLRLARKQAELKEAERKLTAAYAKTVEQEKSILDVSLQQKKKDISTLALDARIKQEWAEKLDGMLTHIEQSRGHTRLAALKKLREEIRGHMHVDNRVNQFQQNIETLSTEFYDNLNARNPDLSKTEVRLVSLLKLRLTNDEIAMLQGISTKSVIMSRYRLRKKLGLPESVDLDAYCQSM
jgi:DNA-binding CsgD family transcriptional regulator/tetratricopeptide (TPR) repeat protein